MVSSEIDLKLIGAHIREVRLSKSMSQQDLAAKAALSLPLISKIEHGKTHLQLETFIKIVEALQVSADQLIRADVPVVNSIYQGELSDEFKDCTPSEMEAILKVIKEMKSAMHRKSED